jgi:predicted signal transduction protein with EAL and GGDEF domain
VLRFRYVRIGISVVTLAQGSFDMLYRQADIALFRAKGAGRDRHAFYAAQPRINGADQRHPGSPKLFPSR